MPILQLGDSTKGLFGGGGGLSGATLTDAAGAVTDIFGTAESDKAKEKGDLLEEQNYLAAANLAGQNEKFTETSTAIKTAQIQRQTTLAMGTTTADIANAGFATSGSGLDILADNASQAALTKSVASEQGLITEAGYTEQQKADTTMADAAQVAAEAEHNAAGVATVSGIIKGAASIATLF